MTGNAALLLATLCMVLTGGFGVLFALNPEKGMKAASHWPAQLPLVMSDRYIGTAFLLLGVLLWGDWWLLAWFLAVVGIAGFGDVFIYLRAGRPHGPHLVAALLYLSAAGLALAAHMTNGTP
ncbi:MAG: hypothetical protein KF887_10410 [Paracoccaceae bacterium]|nr:MAG: hypothetical protein KF887_10410 [Paracoccaceae bacterium]